MKLRLKCIGGMAMVGTADSLYGLWQHYAPLGSSVCNWGQTFNCDIVNKSVFSEVAGIPVAAIGLAGYLAILALAILSHWKISKNAVYALVALAAGGLTISFILTFIEAYYLRAFCPVCLLSQFLMLAIAVCAVIVFHKHRQTAPSAAE